MYSELVDTAITRSGRPDKAADLKAYANQTMRDMQARRYFASNLVEDQVTPTDDPYVLPRPVRLQKWRTVRYADGSFPAIIMPGRAQRETPNYYYLASTYITFKGCGLQPIDVAYYQFQPNLAYYAVAERPAVYDQATEMWTYSAAYDDNDTTRAAARALVSNWLLLNWYDLVLEGVLAKVFKQINDETRATTHYAFFERTYADSFLAAEVHEGLGA